MHEKVLKITDMFMIMMSPILFDRIILYFTPQRSHTLRPKDRFVYASRIVNGIHSVQLQGMEYVTFNMNFEMKDRIFSAGDR